MKKRNNRTRKSNQNDEVLQVLANSPNKALNYKQIGAQVPQISYKEVSQILEQKASGEIKIETTKDVDNKPDCFCCLI